MRNTDTFIKDLERTFAVTPADVKNTIADFHSEMKLGLSGKKSSLKMLPSFVVRPRGTEKGRYLALDLGGTNLRFLAVELDGKGKAAVLAVDRFVIEKNLMCGAGEMIINMEWGNFARLTRTSYDIEVDKASQNAGFHFLEKMVSGMYLGELTRRIVSDTGRPGLCNAFLKEYSFKTGYMSLIAAGNFKIPAEFGLNNATADDREALKSICKIVSLRSARMSGMAIAAVVTWMDPKLEREHTIGIDGSLFEGYPGFKENIVGVFTDLFGVSASKIRLEMAKDGSGIGAAMNDGAREEFIALKDKEEEIISGEEEEGGCEHDGPRDI